jgi:hypothetical protein
MTNDPVRDALASGFQALLRGDTAERDRQVVRARKIMAAQDAVPNMDMSRAEIIASLLRLVERKAGRALTEIETQAVRSNPEFFMRRMIAGRI